MEQKLCKKCSSELPDDDKGARCEDCKAERMWRIKKIGLTVGPAFFMAGVIFAVTRAKSDEDNAYLDSEGSADDESGISQADRIQSESPQEPSKVSGPHTPEIGDIVRVGRGNIPWTVSDVSEISGIVVLSSTETAIQRSDMPWNLKPFE